MAERETVVVDNGERRSSGAWIAAVVAIVVLLILFFAFGGLNLFKGGQSSTDTTNLEVQTTTPTTGSGQ
ncbi:MAG: hypothetical protein JWN33_181 [Candidatus Saccharibacteria bacterium]|nr:hypothetical protein [Candidatus Saccharibacteria bacterium]